MQISQTLQLKISGTKKRLSKTVLNESSLLALGLCALLVCVSFSARVISLGGRWRLIPVDIPVVVTPLQDPGLHRFEERYDHALGSSTFVVAITPNELLYGDVMAFTSGLDDVRNKFLIKHVNGSPQVSLLLSQFEQWALDRKNRLGLRFDGVAIVLPDPVIPVAIVASVVDHLRQSQKFSHVTLGGALQ